MASAGAEHPDAVDPSTIDTAYGAFQRGLYLTAFNEATKRAQQNDPAAMTLLGEIYAQGLGVGRDDLKAAQWYKIAAAKGNRDAFFALAMFNFQGRAGHATLQKPRGCLKPPPGSATQARLMTLACFICRVSSFRRISSVLPNFLRSPQKPAIRRRNTHSLRCTRRAAARRRT